jgi:hypothetical protein
MSRDLVVVTHERPDVAAFAGLEFDGPADVELDDLPETFAVAVLAPRFLMEIHVASDSAAAWTRAVRAAKGVAERHGGAVYDPQEDTVIWPRAARRFRSEAKEERIRVVGLQWFVPRSRCVPETADAFVSATSRFLPEARPTRFGDFEPFQERLEADGAPFAAMYAAKAGAPYGGHMFWSSRAPCFGGNAFVDDPRAGVRRRPDHLPVGGSWSTSLDGRALESDARWREAVVDLFVAVARDVGAFYASATVTRGVIARRGRISYDGTSEDVNVRTGSLEWRPWWQGLPAIPTWLAWFGAPYRDVVRDVRGTEPRGDALLLRCGERPLDSDQLRGVFPLLPERLVARGRPAEFFPAIE